MAPLRPLIVLLPAMLLPAIPLPALASTVPTAPFRAVTVDRVTNSINAPAEQLVHDSQAGATVTAALDGGGVVLEARTDGGSTSQVVRIAPPTGQALTSGTTYTTARTATDQHAGVALSGTRFCADSGSLRVDEITQTPTELTSLTATYRCGGDTSTDRFAGELRWASSTGYRAVRTPALVILPDGPVGVERRQSVVLTAAGTEPVALGTAVLDGFDASRFRLVEDTCSGTVLTDSCSLVVTMTDTEPGGRVTRLRVPDDTALGSRTLWVTSRTIAPPAAPFVRAAVGHDGVAITVSPGTTSDGSTASSFRVERDDAGTWTTVGTRESSGFVLDAPAKGVPQTYRAVAVNAGGESAPSRSVTATRPDRELPAPGSRSLLSVDRGYTGGGLSSSTGTPVVREHGPGYLTLAVTDSDGLQSSAQLWWSGDLAAGEHQLGELGNPEGRPSAQISVRGLSDCGSSGVLRVAASAVRADGTPDVLDADVVTTCGAQAGSTAHLRVNADRSFTAASAAPATVAFGAVARGSQSAATRVTVTSTGPSALTTGAPTLTGDVDFRVVATTCGTVTGTCTVDVAAAPTTTGLRTALLEVPDGTLRGRRSIDLSAYGTGAPEAPQHVTAAFAAGRAALTWSPPSNDGGSPVTGYRIHRIAAGTAPVLAATLAGAAQRWDVSGLTVGASYSWTVTAVNALGNSPASAAAGGTVPRRQYVVAAYDPQRDRYDIAITGGGPAAPLRLQPDGDQATPAVSRDGQSIAWSQDLGSGYLLSIGPIRGGGASFITSGSGRDDLDPAFSPDGNRLAFTRYDGDVPVLATVARTGGTVTVVPGSQGLYRPTWTTDGKRLVAGRVGFDLTTGAPATPRLEVIAVDGSSRSAIPGGTGGVDPSVSPDGTRIAYVDATQSQRVAILPLAGGTPRVIATNSGANSRPSWTPDSAAVAFQHEAETGSGLANGEVLEARADGTGLRAVTTTPDIDELEPVVVDADTAAPTVAMAALARASTAAQVRVSWTGSDAGSGVASYDVRVRKARFDGTYGLAAYPSSWQGLKAGSVVVTTARGIDQCVSVRARDRAGNASAWTAERCTASPLDDRSLKASTGWSRATQTAAFLKTETAVRRTGATLSLATSQYVRGWLVATTCSTCGAVKVTVGGRLLGTVSTYGATTKRQVLLPLPGAGTLRKGAIALTTTSTKPVYVDGLALARS